MTIVKKYEKQIRPLRIRRIPRILWWAIPSKLRIKKRFLNPNPLRLNRGVYRSKNRKSGLEKDLNTNLIQLALITWRLGKRIASLHEHAEPNHLRPLIHSLSKYDQLLESHEIEYRDYDNKRYNEGMLEVEVIEFLAPERDIEFDTISHTSSPSVYIAGELKVRASVYVWSKTMKSEN